MEVVGAYKKKRNVMTPCDYCGGDVVKRSEISWKK
jgi:hypothetical protein